MKRFYKWLVIPLMIFSFVIFGCEEDPSGPDEPGTVEGVVTHLNTGGAIVGAVINDGTADVATSGTGGNYSFEIDEGTYTFTCTAEGYNMQVAEDIEVDAGETTTLNFQLEPINVLEINDDIVGDVTWKNNNIYLINGEIIISAVLTIEAGTRIKFKDNARFVVFGNEGGLILAEVTTLLPIIFTSWHDDTHGGDTNGNGTASEPARGDWYDIHIYGDDNASSFYYCEFYYGGGNLNKHVINLEPNTAVDFTNCTFAHNQGEEGALNAHAAGSGTVIQNNIFYDNTWPLSINSIFNLDDTNIFHNPDSRSDINDHNGIMVSGNVNSEEIIWSETEVPFVLHQGEYLITAGNKLTIEQGVMLKFEEGTNLIADGTIVVSGSMTEPVIFTSYKDDTVGGDTNNDTNTTSPNPGDWDYIKICGIGNSSNFNYCHFYYGGGAAQDYTLCLYDGPVTTITNCTFVHNKGADDCVLDAWFAGAGTAIEANTFYHNEKPLQINGRINISSSNMFRNPNNYTQSNQCNGIFIDRPGEYCIIEGDITWSESEFGVAFVSLHHGINAQGETNILTLAEDVILKFDGGVLEYEGDNLFNYDAAGVWFTSYHDDEHGDDTNGNGTVTIPDDGDWQGIRNWGTSPETWEAWDNILYDDIH